MNDSQNRLVSRKLKVEDGDQKPVFNQDLIKKKKPLLKPTQTKKKSNNEDLLLKILNNIIFFAIFSYVVFLPAVYIPIVPSPLNLNKQAFLIFFVSIGFLAWFGKMFIKNQLVIKKDFILVPIAIFLIVFGLSAWFSQYPEVSIWGAFENEHWSFITVLALVMIFILVFNNLSKSGIVKILASIIASGFIICFFAVLQYFEIYILPIQAFKNPFFNTIGSFYFLGIYSGFLFLLCLGSLIKEKTSIILKILLFGLALFFFFILTVVNLKIIYVALIFALALFCGSLSIRPKKNKNGGIQLIMMFFLILGVLFLIRNKPLMVKNSLVEIHLNASNSVSVALKSLSRDSLLGVGPGNYVYQYRLFRPEIMGDFWQNDFEKAYSYFFTLVSTTGVLGSLAFLFLIIYGLYYLFKRITQVNLNKKAESGFFLLLTFGGGWLYYMVIMFGFNLNITLLFFFWLSLSLFVTSGSMLTNNNKDLITSESSPKTSLVFSFLFVLVLISFISLNYTFIQKYASAYYFQKALNKQAENQPLQEIGDQLNKAISLNANKDIYYNQMSRVLFALANQRASENQENLTVEDSDYISQMIKGALDYSQASVTLNSNNSKNFQNQAHIYEGVIGVLEGAHEKAIDLYEQALKIDPKNPYLYYEIANIEVIKFDVLMSEKIIELEKTQKNLPQDFQIPEDIKKHLYSAKTNIEKALAIKRDFLEPNLLLTEIYEREGEINKAIDQAQKNKEISKNQPRVIFRLGLLYYKNNQINEAKQEFEQAIKIDPDYANARYFLGLILDQLGNKEMAKEHFIKIKELNHENKDIDKILQNLNQGKEALAGIQKNEEKINQGIEQNDQQEDNMIKKQDDQLQIEKNDQDEDFTENQNQND
ncbi:MAG: tetratricopeptide repeat protein [Candidatus Moranbacteria bacterium]|nr:tetratricopeptide repeat protein [Candidatus Moranbacteria bacterium]